VATAAAAAGAAQNWLDRTKDSLARKKAVVFGTVAAVAAVALGATAIMGYKKASGSRTGR
jgi:hypothetical protein